MSAALWAFYALIGTQAGLSDAEVSHAIAIAMMGALIGSGLVPLIGNSFGRVGPMTLGALAAAGASFTLCFSHNPVVYRVATCVNVAAMYVMLPYFLGAAAEEDPSGRGVATIGGVYLLIGAISPSVGGILMQTVGLRTMGTIVLVTSAAAWLAFVVVDVALKKRAHGRPRPEPEIQTTRAV